MYYLLENADYPAFQILPLRCILASVFVLKALPSVWWFSVTLYLWEGGTKSYPGLPGGCLWAGLWVKGCDAGWFVHVFGSFFWGSQDAEELKVFSLVFSSPSREDNSCSVSRWKRGQGLPAAPELALVILLTWWITMTWFLMLNPLDHDEFFLVYCWNGFADALLRISVSVLMGAIFL